MRSQLNLIGAPGLASLIQRCTLVVTTLLNRGARIDLRSPAVILARLRSLPLVALSGSNLRFSSGPSPYRDNLA